MANKKWIQKANKKMKEKGTVGSFTKYCGGRVTQSCIDRAIKSDDPTLRRRAQFAANMRGIGTFDCFGASMVFISKSFGFPPSFLRASPDHWCFLARKL